MKRKLTFLILITLCFGLTTTFAQIPEGYVSIYTLKGEAEKTPVVVDATATSQLAGPANGWGELSDYDFSKYRKLVINLTFDPADAGKQVAVRFNVNAVTGSSNVKLEKFTLPETGTDFSAVIDLEKYAQDGKVGVGGIIYYNGATHWSFTYDGTPATKAVTVNYVAVGDEIIDYTIIPEGYISIYELKGEAEKTPLEVAATTTSQLAGPANGWGDLADYDFSKYRKLAINLTFDPADAGKQIAVRFNVNAVVGSSNVKLETFTLPASGTNFSAVIDLQKYAQDGLVGVGGIVFYNGATHWSFTYDGTPTTQAVTINYVAVGDEIIDYTIMPEDYISIYEVKGEAEKAPLVVDAAAIYQLAGPAQGWGDLADWDFSPYKNLVINLTFDPADAGKQVAVRFNVNAVAGTSNVKLEKFTLPMTGDNFAAVIDLEKYAQEGKVGVGGIIFYNGATHWSFTYDGTPATMPVTINYVAVGPVEVIPVIPVTTLMVEKLIVGAITDDADYKVVAHMKWDSEKVYVDFEINDDVLYTEATNAYESDNIEIYFDLDNSKNPLWPRNAGWPNSSYDANDIQLRILPGKEWAAHNTKVEGVVLTTTMKDGGYDISVTIPWSTLQEGFTPAAGTKIGFDILASDNDNDSRNQLTWYANTDMPWNDASLFGTVELAADGTFTSVPDVTAPEQPVVTTTVEGKKVTLAWTLPVDDIAVLKYDVKQDNVIIKEKIYALATGNSLVINDLADGTYTFTVVAYDNSGNTSSSDSEVVINTTNVVEIKAGFKAYPNPSNGVVQVESGSNSISVLEVFNMSGQRIVGKSFVNNCSIDLSDYSNGIFILKVITDNQVNTTRINIR